MSSGVPSIFKPPTSDEENNNNNNNKNKNNNNSNNNNSDNTSFHSTQNLIGKATSFEENTKTTKNNTMSSNNDTLPPLLNRRVRKIAWGVFGTAIVVTSICLIAVSLKKLTSTQQGLEYTKRTKQLDDAIKTGGLHAGPPGFKFVKFPSVQITEDLPEDVCLSQDGLRIRYRVTFQYVLPSTWVYNATIKYRNYDRWSELVAVAGNSAIQHSCSEFVVTDFQNQRTQIQNKMMENLQLTLEGPNRDGTSGVYAQAISVSLRNIELPSGYTNAIAQKEEAAQDIELAINQRSQETTKAGTQLLSAQEEALKIMDTARNDANITLTRAELKAQETLFSLETEANILVKVRESFNLSTEGLLAYMANQLYAGVSDLKVSAGEPAKLSRKDEL